MHEKRFAFLFPGQGSQYVGMGRSFHDAFLSAREVFQYADDYLDYPLTRRIFSGEGGTLADVRYCQVAVYVVSMAIYRVLCEQCAPLSPYICAGLSLGEYSALVASGRLSWTEGLGLIQERALAMEAANRRQGGQMAAVWGLSVDAIQRAGFWVANVCTQDQVVIAGSCAEIQRAKVILHQRGAKKVLILNVQGAFHSPLMQSALHQLEEAFSKIALQKGHAHLVMNLTGIVAHTPEEILENLLRQTTHSVNWYACMRTLETQTLDGYIAMGPGRTLSGINRRIGIGMKTVTVQEVRDLEQVMEHYEAIKR